MTTQRSGLTHVPFPTGTNLVEFVALKFGEFKNQHMFNNTVYSLTLSCSMQVH
jgi:hypothetical protein